MSCRWQSPPSSHTGQSCGWFSISHSTTDSRNLTAGRRRDRDARVVRGRRHARHDDAPGRVFVVAVLQRRRIAGTRRSNRAPDASRSTAGRGRRTNTRAAGFPFRPPRTFLPSTSMMAMGGLPSSRSRGRRTYGADSRGCWMCASNSSRKYLIALASGSIAPVACSAERVARRADQLRVLRNDVEIAGFAAPRFEIGEQSVRATADLRGTACRSRTIPARKSAAGCATDRRCRSSRRSPSSCRCPCGCRPPGSCRSPSPDRDVARRGNPSTRRPAAAPLN